MDYKKNIYTIVVAMAAPSAWHTMRIASGIFNIPHPLTMVVNRA